MMSGDDRIKGYEDKLEMLQIAFKISVSREMREEVLDLCNLNTGVYNKGISGGEMKKARAMAYKLQDKGMVREEIADMVEVSIDTVQEWLAQRKEI